MDFLDIVTIVRHALKKISPQHIVNTWRHVDIQPESSIPPGKTTVPATLKPRELAWAAQTIARTQNAGIKEAEKALKGVLGEACKLSDWQTAISIACEFEDDDLEAAQAAEERLEALARQDGPKSARAADPLGLLDGPDDHLVLAQHTAEAKLNEQLDTLADLNRLKNRPTIEDILDNKDEPVIDLGYRCARGLRQAVGGDRDRR